MEYRKENEITNAMNYQIANALMFERMLRKSHKDDEKKLYKAIVQNHLEKLIVFSDFLVLKEEIREEIKVLLKIRFIQLHHQYKEYELTDIPIDNLLIELFDLEALYENSK